MNAETVSSARAAALAALFLMLAALLALSPRPAHAQDFTRVIVTLDNNNRDREITDLFNGLSGTEYRLVESYTDRPVLILDVSRGAYQRLASFPFIASIREDGVSQIPEGPIVRAPAPSSYLTYRLTITPGVDFGRAQQEIRRHLSGIRHDIVSVDPRRGEMIVAMAESDMPVVGTLNVVQSAVAIAAPRPGRKPVDGAFPQPPRPERPEPVRPRPGEARGSERLIVQYGPGNRRSEIRRIRRALEGIPHEIVRQMDVSRMIVVETNRRGMNRLMSLDGVQVWRDGVDHPAGPAGGSAN